MGKAYQRLCEVLKKADLLVSILICFEIVYFIWLREGRRLGLHDTFYRFSIQFFLMNNKVIFQEIPQWMPFQTHGAVSTCWFGLANVNGFLAYFLFPFANFLKNFNFLTIFHLGVLLDKIILLLGSWFLSKKLYANQASCYFVTISLTATSIWLTQSFWCFHLFFAIPFILYFFHQFIDSGHWRYLFLSCNLFFLQTLSNTAYAIPITSLAIFLYFFFYIIFFHKDIFQHIKILENPRRGIMCLVLILLSALPFYYANQLALDKETVWNIPYRSPDGKVPLNVYLNWGNHLELRHWQEIFLGFSPGRDYTLYFGLFSAVMVLVAILSPSKRNKYPFVFSAFILFLITMRTPMAILFYHIWPLMKYYRHLFLISGLVKFFLCFIAGFGFDVFIEAVSAPKQNFLKKCIPGLVIFFMGTLSFKFYSIASDFENLSTFAQQISMWSLDQYPLETPLYLHKIQLHLYQTALFALIFIGLIFILIFSGKKLVNPLIIFLILGLHTCDVYSYALSETEQRSISLEEEALQSHMFTPFSFPKRRVLKIDCENDPKAKILLNKKMQQYAKYWTVDSYLFLDRLKTSLRTDYWQKSLDDLMKVYSNKSSPLPNNRQSRKMLFPTRHQAIQKFSGFTQDKIQFFEYAYHIPDVKMADILKDSEFTGDILFVSLSGNEREENADIKSWAKAQSLNKNERLDLPYLIKAFSANHIKIDVFNPLKRPIWLFYSDTWHQGWQVKINGQYGNIYKAMLAYKAILLHPGPNDIHFFFRLPLLNSVLFFVSLNVGLWYFIFGFYLIRLHLKRH